MCIIYIYTYYNYIYIQLQYDYMVSISLKCCSKSSGNSHKAKNDGKCGFHEEFSGAMFGGASSIAVQISGRHSVAVLKGRVTGPASSRGI